MVTLRPGQRILQIPAIGVQTSRRAVSVAAAADWWAVAGKTCVAAYQPKGAADLSSSYVNLARSGTNNAAPVSAPAFDASTGWTFNYNRLTSVIPAQGWSMFARYTCVNMASNPWVFGSEGSAADATPFFGVRPGNAFGPGITVYHGSANTWEGSFASGVAGNAGATAYFNGNSLGSISWAAAESPRQIIIGNVKLEGQGFPFFGSIQALVIYSDTLTAGEVATVSAAMAAL